MDLQFLGATGTVSGSKYLLRSGGCQVLVDCGLFQGYKQLRLRNWAPLPIDPRSLDAVVLTHAHLDHSGYLPLLVRNGYAGKIHATEATHELCKVLLPDSARLLEEEAEYANRKSFSKHKPALPLYTEKDAAHCLKRFAPVKFGKRLELGKGLSVELLPAGHLLGAAMLMLRSPQATLVFSGDLGRAGDVLMRPPAARPASDYLVLESTYGDRLHPAEPPEVKLAEVVNRTASRQGVVVIPSFTVGRAQSVLYLLWKLRANGQIPDIPTYVNSPMATDASRIYASHLGEHQLSPHDCELVGRSARFVQTVEESQALNARKGPMIIIAGSGMATGGRVVHHLKAFLSDARNTVLFTGFQAGGTRGAAMVGGAEAIKIHGGYVPVRAEIAMLENLSAHADAREIIDWLKTCKQAPRKVFVTHGEPLAADALRLRIEETLGYECVVPEFLQRVTLA
jgi:metallo-beta-lactamase family protein